MNLLLNKIKQKDSSRLWFFLLMIFPIFFWASAFILINRLLTELSFISLTIMRFFIVSIFLIPLIIFQFKKFDKLYKKDIFPIFLLGFFGIIVYHLGLNYGEQYISPGAASLIISTVPIFVVFLAIFFLKEKISYKKILGISISFIGIILISLWGTADVSIRIDYVSGAAGALLAAIMAALYTIAGKKMLKRYSALSLTVYAMLLGSIGLIPFINKTLFEQVSGLSYIGWLSLLFLGLLSTIIAYIIWYIALEIKDASELSIYLYLVPVISTTISLILGLEKITIIFLFGAILIISGLLILNSKKKYLSSKITIEQKNS